MLKGDLVRRLAARAGVGRAQTQAVLDALAEMDDGHGHRMPPEAVDPGTSEGGRVPASLSHALRSGATRVPAAQPLRYQPASTEVARLIEDARGHPLGLEFLIEGELGSVAVTFGVHAFTVDAARRHLGVGQD
jgi:hypothetical protein